MLSDDGGLLQCAIMAATMALADAEVLVSAVVSPLVVYKTSLDVYESSWIQFVLKPGMFPFIREFSGRF